MRWSNELMARFNLDPNNPPKVTAARRERLDAMTDAVLTAAAEADIDNPQLTDVELNRLRTARAVRGHVSIPVSVKPYSPGRIIPIWRGSVTWKANYASPGGKIEAAYFSETGG